MTSLPGGGHRPRRPENAAKKQKIFEACGPKTSLSVNTSLCCRCLVTFMNIEVNWDDNKLIKIDKFLIKKWVNLATGKDLPPKEGLGLVGS